MADFNEIKTPDMDEPWSGQGLPPAVGKALLALAGAVAVLVIPYLAAPVVPDAWPDVKERVAEYRVWLPEDPIPFSKLFQTSRPKASEVAHGKGNPDPSSSPPDEVTGAVDPEVAPVAIDPIAVDPVVDVKPDADAKGGDVAAAPEPDAKTGPAKVEPAAAIARIHIPAAAWEGLATFIEDPNGAMKPFYDKLAQVALKEPNAVVRISHFGDSAIAADGMPSAARRLLQKTFGDGGHGFSLVAASNNWYRRKDVIWSTSGFQTETYIQDNAKDRRYGFGGTAAIGYAGAKASWKTVEGPEGTVGTKASRFVVSFLAQKGGGRIAVNVDGEEKQVIDTEAATPEDRQVVVEVPDAAHTFELKNAGGGKIKVYGVALERASGVVYDGLGTIGARDSRWVNVDPDHARAAFASRGVDLAVFMYGGNQLEDKISMARYQEMLTEVVKLWKSALVGKSCLLMSSIDHGERYRGRVRTVPRLTEIMKVQREVALAEGCAWFSLYDAMGGPGTIGTWFDTGLAEGDLAHPTAKGAIVLGQLFYKALMQGFAGYIEARKAETPK